jgi:hypothetical protein
MASGELLSCSPKSSMPKAMLAKGSTISRADWEAASGPTAKADSSRTVPVTPLTTTAYTDQWRNIPSQP